MYSVQCTPEGAMVLHQQYMIYLFVLRQYSVHQRVLWSKKLITFFVGHLVYYIGLY